MPGLDDFKAIFSTLCDIYKPNNEETETEQQSRIDDQLLS
ncbi:MAG: hypothetical protein OFPI_01590 [Osedax symbiont Rs2]|nr:MAG: hypothetical protein OFPI_01590 [Osedax symbiont Rs2]